MALSNKFGWLVLTTGNKSEMAVGYATLYGDTAGGYGVLKDVLKTRVFRLCRSSTSGPRRADPRGGHHEAAVGRAPTRPARRREPPPYEVLDEVLRQYVEQDRAAEIIRSGLDGGRRAGRPAGRPGGVQAPADPAGPASARRRSARTAASRSPTGYRYGPHVSDPGSDRSTPSSSTSPAWLSPPAFAPFVSVLGDQLPFDEALELMMGSYREDTDHPGTGSSGARSAMAEWFAHVDAGGEGARA